MTPIRPLRLHLGGITVYSGTSSLPDSTHEPRSEAHTFVSKGFERIHYKWFTDKSHTRVGYGDIEWRSDGTRHTGSFQVSDDATLGLPVEALILVNELRQDQPTFLVKLNGVHAARIDVNGFHHFSGERGGRQATHFQANDRGSDAIESTIEIAVPPFPALARGVNVSYEAEMQRCFRASVAWLNVDVTGVKWTPLPFEGGK